MKKKPIVIFLIFTFAIPLISIILFQAIPNLKSGAGYYLLFGLEAISPTLAAIFTVYIFGGWNALVSFFERCYINNIRLGLIAFAVCIPVIEILLTQIMLVILTGKVAPFSGISPMRFLIVVFALIAEEVGWRGYLQDWLDKIFGSSFVPILVGLIWALWHYHFYMIGTMSFPIHWFLIGCIADSYIYYWITKEANGNIIPVSFLHFTYNLISSLFLVNTGGYIFLTLSSVIIAIMTIIWGVKSTKMQSHECL